MTDDEEVSALATKSCSDITSSNILQVAYAIIYLKMDSLDTQELDVSSDSNEDIGSGTEGKEPFEEVSVVEKEKETEEYVRKMAASLALDVTTPEAKLGQIVKRISFSKEALKEILLKYSVSKIVSICETGGDDQLFYLHSLVTENLQLPNVDLTEVDEPKKNLHDESVPIDDCNAPSDEHKIQNTENKEGTIDNSDDQIREDLPMKSNERKSRNNSVSDTL